MPAQHSARPLALLLLAIAAALPMAGCQEAAKPAAKAPPVPEVGVVTLRPERVALSTELPGRTAAFMMAEVRPQVGGIVRERPFREGAEIAKGDLLYQIDPAPYRAAHESAKAGLAKAEASLASARAKAQRYKGLAAIRAVSAQDLDDADASLRQVEAEIAASAAAVETARINLDFTRVTSPISGRIGKSSVTAGALVTASQASALATVQQLDPMYVDVTQSSAEVLRLRRSVAGDSRDASARVRLILEDGSAYPEEGTLEFSDVTVNPGTGGITLRAVFPNPRQDLLPGMYVRAVVQTGVAEAGLLVPQQGVSRDARGNPSALFLGADGKVESRTLTVRSALGDKWLLEDGAKAGDRVVVEGVQKVRAGAMAKAVNVGESVVAGEPQASAAAVRAK
jgi:membrane fusion protein (multidrug efflux system)